MFKDPNQGHVPSYITRYANDDLYKCINCGASGIEADRDLSGTIKWRESCPNINQSR